MSTLNRIKNRVFCGISVCKSYVKVLQLIVISTYLCERENMPNIIRKLVENDKKELKKLNKMALQVESFADEMEHLTDEQLKAKTPN